MSFQQRQLRLTFSGEQTGTVQVSGLRAYASIQAFTGKLGVAAQVRVWGLSLAQMNTYSSKLSAGVGINEFNLTIEAGDVGQAGQLCESARTVQASVHLQLQGALGSLWAGRPEDAVALIERAIAISQHWARLDANP